MRTVNLSAGPIAYRDLGDGPPVVFVHGLLVNGEIWRGETGPLVDAGYRCLVPTWPLGAHPEPMRPDADLTPSGLAGLVGEFLDALDLQNVTLVGNDTGGALVQILMTRRPERVGRVVLASCDVLDRFPPPPFGFLAPVSRLPGSLWVTAQLFRIPALLRLPIALGWVAKRPVPREVTDSYLAPIKTSRAVRRDLGKLVRGFDKRHTLDAFEANGDYDRPVLLLWAKEDRLFPLPLAERLARKLPDARLELVEDSYTFISEDRPGLLAEKVKEFAILTR
ncbi:alpha/beta fold hydrolase [Actinomadura opuntiae]|uniref:alpha/beta fold hydrolase n=1 Tax=Actinomadura sp. OS1-43 TaxID=604315 RepID=UPI00255B2D37|nr:alpha/beta hydrolase [Actinomadura sp. OS1-43]MDL4816478.1 alpha/beta hydrolase [Actinomadura sp. OS1-43]